MSAVGLTAAFVRIPCQVAEGPVADKSLSLRSHGARGVALQSEPHDLAVIEATTSRLLSWVRLSPCFTRGSC